MDNLNNYFRVQMLSKCTQNAVQNALKILFGKTDFKMHVFQNGKMVKFDVTKQTIFKCAHRKYD